MSFIDSLSNGLGGFQNTFGGAFDFLGDLAGTVADVQGAIASFDVPSQVAPPPQPFTPAPPAGAGGFISPAPVVSSPFVGPPLPLVGGSAGPLGDVPTLLLFVTGLGLVFLIARRV